MTPDRRPALVLADVGCERGERRLFSGVDAAVPSGTLLRVRGTNGAGKTTLLRAICGLTPAATGRITWRGEPVSALRDAAGLVHLGHANGLKDALSALENLRSDCALAGRPCGEADALDALARAGLRGLHDRPVRMLSQGQRRRAALARLPLAAAASLWVLDEPFEALDPVASDWLARLIGTQLARGGVVVLTSHIDRPDLPTAHTVTIDLDRHRAHRAEASA